MTRPEGKDPATWPKCSYFAVYDGHGGNTCADFLKDYLHTYVINAPQFPEDPAAALVEGCKQAEKRFLSMVEKRCQQDAAGEWQVDKSGSCAIVVLTVEKECYVANVGDSRAVISTEHGMRTFDLSQDHRPNEEKEFYRIRDNGGHVYQTQTCQHLPILDKEGKVTGQHRQIFTGPYRVNPGRLSVSRTFGDIEAKLPRFGGLPGVISAEPEVAQFTIVDQEHDFIVLGCDGIFEKLSSVNVVDSAWSAVTEELRRQSSDNEAHPSFRHAPASVHQLTGKMADAILRGSALERSIDNLTVVVVGFKSLEHFYESYVSK